ncbi:hypothetical protein ARMSODRAFT_982459 [Armillaria solidipes]|uniref:Uncharacterized protein n=1 Tax=Armillaria solidipes TaxID=1076256 RepID=A0A2H3B6M5_9AGAR|nr:hypothetical protein ARMSODRAFT_982459 [Armillaria solidipes]
MSVKLSEIQQRRMEIATETCGAFVCGPPAKEILKEYMPWNEATPTSYKHSEPSESQFDLLVSIAGLPESEMYRKYFNALEPVKFGGVYTGLSTGGGICGHRTIRSCLMEYHHEQVIPFTRRKLPLRAPLFSSKYSERFLSVLLLPTMVRGENLGFSASKNAIFRA